MASKVASVAETAETREEAAEAPLLDQIAVAIKKMVARGKERGYLTYDELNAALPTDRTELASIANMYWDLFFSPDRLYEREVRVRTNRKSE